MKKIVCILLLATGSVSLSAQSLLNSSLNKAKNAIKNSNKSQESPQSTTNSKTGSEYTTENGSFSNSDLTGNTVVFAFGERSQASNNVAGVSEVNLSKPSYFYANLKAPFRKIKESFTRDKYDLNQKTVVIKYYADGEFIASFSDVLSEDAYMSSTIIPEVLVPSSMYDYKASEFKVSTLAHVFSGMNVGIHTLKVEYVLIMNVEVPSAPGSAAISYEHKEIIAASGEVKVNIVATELNTYCKSYGRPKFSKGVLASDAKVDTQVTELIKNNRGVTPVYVFADDNWILQRNYQELVVSREVLVYYIFTNKTGRCEMGELRINQAYDGKTYYAPKEVLNKSVHGFRYVCCQNY